MEELKRLLEILRAVPDELYDQYTCNIRRYCGCSMYHYQIQTGQEVGRPAFNYAYGVSFSITDDEWFYIFSIPERIRQVAKKNGWPLTTMDVHGAIERVEFVISRHQTPNA